MGPGGIQQAWTSHSATDAAPALVVNGVLFALHRGDRASHAVLYAIDASTGKDLWNSGSVIASWVPKSGGIAAGGSTIYFGTFDGNLMAFGFPIEH
jgi:outer membrane protein assembly factor BamB